MTSPWGTCAYGPGFHSNDPLRYWRSPLGFLISGLGFPGLTSPSPRMGKPVDALEHSRVKQASLQLKILYRTPRGVLFMLLVPTAAVWLFPNLRSHWWARRSAIGCLRNFIIFSKGRIYSRGFLRWSFMLTHFELWVFKLLRNSGSWWPEGVAFVFELGTAIQYKK